MARTKPDGQWAISDAGRRRNGRPGPCWRRSASAPASSWQTCERRLCASMFAVALRVVAMDCGIPDRCVLPDTVRTPPFRFQPEHRESSPAIRCRLIGQWRSRGKKNERDLRESNAARFRLERQTSSPARACHHQRQPVARACNRFAANPAHGANHFASRHSARLFRLQPESIETFIAGRQSATIWRRFVWSDCSTGRTVRTSADPITYGLSVRM
jgi:hypothetical protein